MIQSEAKPKKCRNYAHCNNTFMPFRTTDAYCSPNCHKALMKPKQAKKLTQSIVKRNRSEPSRRTRLKMLAKKRDFYVCQLAGASHQCDSRREAHHIIYLSEQGPDELWNLITLCGYAHHEMAHKSKSWQPRLLAIVNGPNFLEAIDTSELSPRVVQKLKYLSTSGE